MNLKEGLAGGGKHISYARRSLTCRCGLGPLGASINNTGLELYESDHVQTVERDKDGGRSRITLAYTRCAAITVGTGTRESKSTKHRIYSKLIYTKTKQSTQSKRVRECMDN